MPDSGLQNEAIPSFATRRCFLLFNFDTSVDSLVTESFRRLFGMHCFSDETGSAFGTQVMGKT